MMAEAPIPGFEDDYAELHKFPALTPVPAATAPDWEDPTVPSTPLDPLPTQSKLQDAANHHQSIWEWCLNVIAYITLSIFVLLIIIYICASFTGRQLSFHGVLKIKM